MAYDSDNLSALGYANGFTQWHYKSDDDALATIMADGYFDDAANMMRVGDRITIKASDALWEDEVWSVTTTAGSEDVAIGVQVLTVDDSVDGAQYKLGLRKRRYDGTEWIYLEADAAIDEADTVIIHADYGTEALTTTLAAAGTGQGKKLAVAPEGSLSQAIATGDFYWGCIYAPGAAGILANMEGAAVKYTQLYTEATAGHLSDTFVSAGKVMGIVATVTAGTADQTEIVEINYPFLAADIDTATGGGG